MIAMFIFSGATEEGKVVRFRQRLRGHTVQQAYANQIPVLQPADSLREAAIWSARGVKDFPVSHFGRYVGFLSNARLTAALQKGGAEQTVAAVMARDVQPVSLTADLYDVQKRLNQEKLSALPVVENGRVVGLITNRHIHEMLRMATLQPTLFPRVAVGR